MEKTMRNIIIMILFAITSIIGLSGCKQEVKTKNPQVSIYNTITGFNRVQFDMKIDDKGTFINDVNVSISKSGNELSVFTTKDGINHTGDTGGIYFINLEFGTKYTIEINVNFSSDNVENHWYSANTFDVTTENLDDNIGIKRF